MLSLENFFKTYLKLGQLWQFMEQPDKNGFAKIQNKYAVDNGHKWTHYKKKKIAPNSKEFDNFYTGKYYVLQDIKRASTNHTIECLP